MRSLHLQLFPSKNSLFSLACSSLSQVLRDLIQFGGLGRLRRTSIFHTFNICYFHCDLFDLKENLPYIFRKIKQFKYILIDPENSYGESVVWAKDSIDQFVLGILFNFCQFSFCHL